MFQNQNRQDEPQQLDKVFKSDIGDCISHYPKPPFIAILWALMESIHQDGDLGQYQVNKSR